MRTLGQLLLCSFTSALAWGAESSIPHLRPQGSATQLVVDGKPFLIRGGEIGNSSGTNAAWLRPYWDKLAGLNLNTVLAPAYWDLVEPNEGRFDFSTVDALIEAARGHQMRLVRESSQARGSRSRLPRPSWESGLGS